MGSAPQGDPPGQGGPRPGAHFPRDQATFSTLRQKSEWSARLTQKLPRYSAEDQCSCFWVPIPLKKILGFLLVNMRWTDTPSSSVSAFSTPFCPHWEEKHEALVCLVI